MKTSSRGFTLIELLVVITIIGILSSVVLASLTSARSKGSDAAIINELANMRAQAELYYSSNNTYGTSDNSCAGALFGASSTGSLWALITDVDSKNGSTGTVTCDASGTAWAVSASLVSSGQSWCVDSSGRSASTTVDTAASDCQ